MATGFVGITQAGPERDHYFELVQRFPLRPLRTDEELAEAIALIDSLIVRGDLDSGEQDYLDVLANLVEKYESEEHPMPSVSDAQMLRHLIEASRVTQTEVASATEIVNSTISEILAGKRRPTRHQVNVLARYFHVSPMVFSTE
jgi:HTH-type transcriptional regulator/antitoxin HigA